MQSGTPYDIYHHPDNIFVAEFIGDPQNNFFKGEIKLQIPTFLVDNLPNSLKKIPAVKPGSRNISK